MTMSEILSIDEFAEHIDDLIESVEDDSPLYPILFRDTIDLYRVALARIEAPPVPECPWPVDVWPMTDAEYAETVPDECQRTAISGYLMRLGWELCVKALERAAADSTLDELAEKQGVGPATRESLKASLGCIPDAPLHGLDAEQAEQIVESTFDPDAVPIWEAVSAIGAEIPEDEWANVPSDLSKTVGQSSGPAEHGPPISAWLTRDKSLDQEYHYRVWINPNEPTATGGYWENGSEYIDNFVQVDEIELPPDLLLPLGGGPVKVEIVLRKAAE